jgi:hypothetical protein
MRYEKGLLVAAAFVATASAASAQAPAADTAAKTALTQAASALGMVRTVRRALDIVNTFEYTANGTMVDANGGQDKVARITVGYDYVIPAIRLDAEKTTPGGVTRHDIEVAAGPYAWDESKPGVYLRRSNTSTAERLRQIWLMPHAIVLAGAKAPDKVRVADRGGSRELTVAGPDGLEIKGLLDAKNLPTHVELKMGGQVFSADYADYMDFQGYGVMFPAHIEQKIDGRAVADLTVTEALVNPYLIFPPPKEVKP